MIRTSVAFNVNALTVRNLNAYDHLISNGPHIQCVRWKRKPIWLPTAKSKMFRIPVRPVIPEEDKLELKRLHNNYKTLMKSMMSYFIEKEKEKIENLNENTVKANIQKDFEICSYLNDIWNDEVAGLRKQRLAEKRQNRTQEIIMKLEKKQERDLKLQEKVDANIRKAKEEAPTFITANNIDEAIQNALENIVNHNVAIDIHGNFHKDEAETVVSSEARN